jgi:ABC-2 type transport system ATP-binding protein
LTPEEYFYFIGDLRGQNKADALLATHEEFSTAKSKKQKNIYDLSKETRKSGHHRHFRESRSYYSERTVC